MSDVVSARHDRNPVTTVRSIVDRLVKLVRKAGGALQPARLGGRWPVNASSPTGAALPSSAAPSTEAPIAREGKLVRLRAHVVGNRPAFQRWYADDEIARLLRHDQRPLNAIQSRSYFDTIIMPLSARGMGYAIHEVATDRLIGTTALTDVEGSDYRSALFRIVIGEKDCWGRGYGTEATRLVVEEAFERHGLNEVRLEVFRHNARALAAYHRVGFRDTGSHIEFVGRDRFELHVLEMALDRDGYYLVGQEDDEVTSEDSITLATPVGGGDA
jgi:RimJ/RimL family protein N-acetyltransferase